MWCGVSSAERRASVAGASEFGAGQRERASGGACAREAEKQKQREYGALSEQLRTRLSNEKEPYHHAAFADLISLSRSTRHNTTRAPWSMVVLLAGRSPSLWSVVVVVVVVVLLGSCSCAARRPPNVVVFLVDDLGYGDLGTRVSVGWLVGTRGCTPLRSTMVTRGCCCSVLRQYDHQDTQHRSAGSQRRAVQPWIRRGTDLHSVSRGIAHWPVRRAYGHGVGASKLPHHQLAGARRWLAAERSHDRHGACVRACVHTCICVARLRAIVTANRSLEYARRYGRVATRLLSSESGISESTAMSPRRRRRMATATATATAVTNGERSCGRWCEPRTTRCSTGPTRCSASMRLATERHRTAPSCRRDTASTCTTACRSPTCRAANRARRFTRSAT